MHRRLSIALTQNYEITTYDGELITRREFKRRRRVGANIHYMFELVENELYIDAFRYGNGSGEYIAHSCDPNCGAEIWIVNNRWEVRYVTLREVFPGEEFTCNYNLYLLKIEK